MDRESLNETTERNNILVGIDEAILSKLSEVEMKANRKSKTYFQDEFSKEIFDLTYRYGDEEDINARHLAMAQDLASVEKPELQAYWTDKFRALLEDFKFVPGGRITSNAGTGLKGTTYVNCFVSGFRGRNQDSMESILDELKRQALILKSEGGYGFCADVLRPRGAYIKGIGGESPGAVRLLDMWDTQSAVITSGSGLNTKNKRGKRKIRKGAQMVTLSISHPDIEEFITAKQIPGRLTKFNMSVLVSDEFMLAVKNKASWDLIFPDYENAADAYCDLWDGNINKWQENGHPVSIYKHYDDANELWNLIMSSTYSRNEPGILFSDTINRMNNLYYDEYINATNPCGEQVLPIGGCCLLGSLNLTQFINAKDQNWNYQELKEWIPTAVRFLDNVNEKTLVPLPEQKESLENKRRIGMGVLGYGSALMMMKLPYGSKQALEKTEELCNFIMNTAYEASADLAKEKGSFSVFNSKKYLSGQFVKRLDPKIIKKIAKQGLRNSHLLSIQPTGNSSVLANNVSGGLEPVFMADYNRTSVQTHAPEKLGVPTKIDWSKKSFVLAGPKTEWLWQKEGEEDILIAQLDEVVWKYDKPRGLLKETKIRDYAVRYHEQKGTWDPTAGWASTTTQLGIDEHINTLEVFSKYIDSALSKTVNLPQDYPYNDFKRLYYDVFKTGTIKGCTTYRQGTMLSVLSAQTSQEISEQKGVPRTKAFPRPESLNCEIHHVTISGEKWVVLVGLLQGDPYEVFAMKQQALHLPKALKTGQLVKVKSKVYNLSTDDGWLLRDISTFFESDEQEALTRIISTALRHGADIEFIVSQLIKSQGTITSFSKAIARSLKKYITHLTVIMCSDCQSHNIKLQENCFICLDCGNSKCE